MHIILKKFISLAASFAVIFGMMPLGAVSAGSCSASDGLYGEFIVVLEGGALADGADEAELKRVREEFTGDLNSRGVEYSVLYEYSHLMNGVAVSAEYGALEAIKGGRGVLDVIISEEFPAREFEGEEPAVNVNEEELLAAVSENNGGIEQCAYTGKGTVIAIIDTGMDLEHEAFQGEVPEPKIDRDTVDLVNIMSDLNARNIISSDVYKSSKIPFAYNYSNHSTDVTDESEHGTSTAGIAGANSSGIIRGAAPDAQLLIMDVSSKKKGVVSMTDWLAALEDSAKLGADVINISFGDIGSYPGSYNELESTVIRRLTTSGVKVICAQGNNGSFGSKSSYGNGLLPAFDPDSAYGAAPASYGGVMAVACSNVDYGAGIFPDGEYAPGQAAEYSSWGPDSDLTLKPDITAPGGMVFTTFNGNGYALTSGTSMSAPQVSGAAAAVHQYIMEKLKGVNMMPVERMKLSDYLLLSTAEVIRDENGVPYSPRKQGAGQLDLGAAVSTEAYVFSAIGGDPVFSLGESETGSFSFSYSLNNLFDNDLSYDVSVDVLTETLTTDESGTGFIAGTPSVLGSDMVNVICEERVGAGPNGKTVHGVEVSLTDKGRQELSEKFPNGIYIEGFVTLTPEDGAVLSMPFMGFYGNWGDAPVFDASVYDNTQPVVDATSLYYADTNAGRLYPMGSYPVYAEDGSVSEVVYDRNLIYANSNETNNFMIVEPGILRNASGFKETITDSSGAEVFSVSYPVYLKHGRFPVLLEKSLGISAPDDWHFTDAAGLPAEPGEYTLTMSGVIGGKVHSVSLPIIIDNQPPEILSTEVEDGRLKITLRDDNYIKSVSAVYNNTEIGSVSGIIQSEAGGTAALEFELDASRFEDINEAKYANITVMDFARNVTSSYGESFSASEGACALPERINLSPSGLRMHPGTEKKISAKVYPAEARDLPLKWSSSDDSVVTADENGILRAVAPGKAAVTVTSVNGISAECDIVVLEY